MALEPNIIHTVHEMQMKFQSHDTLGLKRWADNNYNNFSSHRLDVI